MQGLPGSSTESLVWDYYGALNGSIFTFNRASDVKFCTHSCSCCVYTLYDVVLRLESENLLNDDITTLFPRRLKQPIRSPVKHQLPLSWLFGALMLW